MTKETATNLGEIGSNKTVLLVEDNPVNQKLATLLLQQLGLTVEVVEDGKEAVESVTVNSYAAILMDCQMPEMDGFEATKAIRKLESARGTYTPIIAVTAMAMTGDKEKCIAVGMDDYIPKPIDRQMLRIKLTHWLQGDSVSKNQELARLYTPIVSLVADEADPIDLVELEDFYAQDLEDVLATFVSSTDKSLVEIKSAIAARQSRILAHLAHELKGASASIGAKSLAKLASNLQRAVEQNDWRDVRDTYSGVLTAFERVKIFLKERNSGAYREVAILPGLE